ncbi:rubredoxin-like domain-containing protein [Segatella baroniae]|uniref:rubredoxin-like domain-containing protein n=1 Tax=Segatella baroniae TaxID=305719 RepID=UPI0028EC0ADE|nr:ferritin family protein [Segatella baroniae]
MKKKFICTVCGYIHEGTEAPEQCPICKAPAGKFKEMEDVAAGDLELATVHYLGAAYKEGVSEELIQHCKDTFAGECGEVYPEVARAYEHYAYEEANHASRYAELLGEVLGDTKSNLEARIAAEKDACAEKFAMAKKAKAEGNDTLHDTIHEMAKDEARHAAGFAGLYKRYFKQ